MGAGDIKDRGTLNAWLDSQPRQVIVLIAARVALRTLPLFSFAARVLTSRELTSRESAPRRFADLTAALFRATALVQVAGAYPTRAAELDAHTAAAAADHAASTVAAAVRATVVAVRAAAARDVAARDAAAAAYLAATAADAADAGYAAAYAANAAADAANAADAYAAADAANAADAYAAADAANAADAYAAADAANAADAYAAHHALWASARADALAIEGDGIQALLRSHLWIAPAPDWVMRAFAALRDALPENENWDVWYTWSADRLNGVVYDERRDFVFAAVPTEVWDRGSAAANAWIRAELDKLGVERSEDSMGSG